MHTIKVKIAIIFLLMVLGYFIISSFFDHFFMFVNNTDLISDMTRIWAMLAVSLILALWVFAVTKTAESIHNYFKFGSDMKHRLMMLEKEKKSMDVFMEVAEREFLKRKISKKTFEDIQRIAGQKIVKIKAEEKEMKDSGTKKAKSTRKEAN